MLFLNDRSYQDLTNNDYVQKLKTMMCGKPWFIYNYALILVLGLQ